jgi:hypothetical protein
MGKELSMLDGLVLDMLAEGKTPRQIAEVTGLSAPEAAKLAYDLLDREIVTDPDQRRKLQVYRLEKIVNALWERTMRNADRDDVKNLVLVLEQLNTLLALNKERDEAMMTRMHAYQFAAYLQALKALIIAFKQLAPDIMSEDEWNVWTVTQVETAQENMQLEIEG